MAELVLDYRVNPGALGASVGAVYINMAGQLCYVLNDGVEHVVPASGASIPSITLAAGVIAASAPGVIITQTWNNAGVTFDAETITITDTASAAASRFVNYLIGASSKFSVDKAGNITAAGAVNKVTLTPPATGATLTLTDGKTLSVTETMVLGAAASGKTFTFPNDTTGIPGLAIQNTWTAAQRIDDGAWTFNGLAVSQSLLFYRWVNTAGCQNMGFYKSRGTTVGDYTIVANNDGLGNIVWLGSNGTTVIQAAQIGAFVDGVPAAGNHVPGRLELLTTPDGAAAPVARLRVNSVGNIGIVSGAQINLDGLAATGDTYLKENAATNIIDLVAGGATTLSLSATGATVTGTLAMSGNLSRTGANGQIIGYKSLTELTTINAAASTDTAIQKPANSIVHAVSVRVTVGVTCTTNFTVGDAGDAARFSTAAVAKGAGSTDPGTKAGAYYNATAQAVRITPDTVPSDATGRVRVTIYYIEVTPPTS